MITRSTLGQAVALALGGIAVIGCIAGIATAGFGPAASAAPVGKHQAASTSGLPVVIACINETKIRPSEYILPCGDGNAYLDHLNWSAWGSPSALASGTYTFNDCTPSCVGGHGHSFGALAVLWDVQPWPGHAGVRYFTRLTIIFTGNRSYTAGGKRYQEPQALTVQLSQIGGG
ncbi:MAG TPA: hypothetical protein VIX15_03640 [Streptosporangiaceae bacterium]